eukprot:Transcript_25560.p1 GENE.Transcript_25560~~Transcript_25560.p1  ORF type:complete len:268 (-),score=80.01 Transcript_25560:289-1017(-)
MPDASHLKVEHFDDLVKAQEFMRGATGRAIGFFSSTESTEHSVFLTVAQQLGKTPSTAPLLARATIGRGTKGCVVYLVPATPVLLASPGRPAKYATPLLQHRLMLPESPDDHAGLAQHHQLEHTEKKGVMSKAAWQTLLEDHAFKLHQFLQAGALGSVTELTPATIEPLVDSTAALGLCAARARIEPMPWPPRTNPAPARCSRLGAQAVAAARRLAERARVPREAAPPPRRRRLPALALRRC